MTNKSATGTEKQKKPYLLLFLLALTAVIWGASYVFQKIGMGHVGPFTFNGVRMLVAGAMVLLASPVMR